MAIYYPRPTILITSDEEGQTMSKNITIGILLVAIIVSGTLWYRQVQQRRAMEREIERIEADTAAPGGHWHGDEWHAEPHPEHEQPTQTVTGDISVEEQVTEDNNLDTQPERRTLWNSLYVDYPPEGAPRPLKQLSYRELYNRAVEQPEHLTDEEVTQAQIEVFFRRPKEKREEIRQTRIEMRAEREFYERIGRRWEKQGP